MPHAVQRRKMICIIGIGYDDVTASFDEQIPPNELFLITNDSVNTINSTKEQSKYIVDFSQHQDIVNLQSENSQILEGSVKLLNPTHICWKLDIYGDVFSAFHHFLNTNDTFRRSFLDRSRLVIQQQPCRANSFAYIHFRLFMPQRNKIHYKSQAMAFKKLLQRIELEDATHWLSTLGGAYSNLGEHSMYFAHKACTNALHQMKIALRSEDPSIIHRCWLYVAMSLMQQGKLLASRKIIEKIYREATSSNCNEVTPDERVMNMCHGIWARLKYVWTSTRRTEKEPHCLKDSNILK